MKKKERQAMIRLMDGVITDLKEIMGITPDNTTVSQANQIAQLRTNATMELSNFEPEKERRVEEKRKIEFLTSEQIAKKYKELTRITPTDERYIWRTQIKWVNVDYLINELDRLKYKQGTPLMEIQKLKDYLSEKTKRPKRGTE